MNYDWHERIEVDLEILHGKPCIKGTRIPAALILGYVAAGRSTEDILREFPDITVEDVLARGVGVERAHGKKRVT